MLKYILFAEILSLQFFRGVGEGMDMHKTREEEGVRHHRWFDIYHRIDQLVVLFAVMIGIHVERLTPVLDNSYKLMLCAILTVAWQIFETMYGIARNKDHISLYAVQENLMGGGINFSGGKLLTFRVIITILFIIASAFV